MAGLGSVEERDYVYLSVAGGYIWNKKADESDPDYGEQSFTRADKTEGIRKGARYEHIDGRVLSVNFKQHDQYGESINVVLDIGQDKDYILAVSTNNRYSQDLMKALLNADLSKNLLIKPYDFVGKDGKRASGCTFKQDGQKIEIKVEEAPSKEGDWFKNATKKAIKRFFEDLNDWYVAEVQEKVMPILDQKANETPKNEPDVNENAEEAEVENKPNANDSVDNEENTNDVNHSNQDSKDDRVSPIKMKRAIKAYIQENYEDETMPKLSGEVLVKWYNLVLEEEELPFEDKSKEVEKTSSENLPESSVDNIDDEIDALMNG